MAESMGASPCYGFLRTFLFVSLFISRTNKRGRGVAGGKEEESSFTKA